MGGIEQLYQRLIAAWNARDAQAMSKLTATDCIMIGFDGSQMIGRKQIEAEIGQVFKDHQTAAYVTIVKHIWQLNKDVAMLHSVVGMVPPGADDIKPEVNAIQLLTAKREGDAWLVAAFQNTPAAFHGRPELSGELTRELRNQLKTKGV